MGLDKKKIIIIEDNEADASVIEDAITTSDLNCEVIRFRDGEEALQALLDPDATVPDVLLLDLNLPRIDGLEVLQRIRSTPRLAQTPVGILTGSGAASDKRRAAFSGATRYVYKPLNYDEYVAEVRQAVAEMLQVVEPGSSAVGRG